MSLPTTACMPSRPVLYHLRQIEHDFPNTIPNGAITEKAFSRETYYVTRHYINLFLKLATSLALHALVTRSTE